jgi:hypothetical protein
MKKREKKLQLNRETVRRLESQGINPEALADARGGVARAGAETGFMTSCIEPNCCGFDTVATQ